MRRPAILAFPLPVGFLACCAVGCSGESGPQAGTSKDAVTQLEAYWADARALDLGDLTRVGVGFATEKLNAQLASAATGLSFEAPAVFGLTAEENRILPKGAKIKSLDAVVTGLGAQFGEHELGTQVNAVRPAHSKTGSDAYFVESAFHAKAGISHGWSFDASGFAGAGVSLGFSADTDLTARVIVATPSDRLEGLVDAPIRAVTDMRGFIYSRSLADIRGMKPGEMFALRGLGHLGANSGIGAPLLFADPTAGLHYQIIASGGVSTVIGGQIDVQLVRLDGDEVVVDVGVQDADAVSVSAAVRDGWGVKSICPDGQRCLRTVNLGPAKVDLSRLVEKAVQQRLNACVNFNLEASASKTKTRVSLSRVRFHLDRGDAQEVGRALEQALTFDVRLAQALYNRDLGDPKAAVSVDFDALRAATTATRNFGFRLLGMIHQRR